MNPDILRLIRYLSWKMDCLMEQEANLLKIDCGGEIYFGGDDGYDGWYDTLTKEQTFDLYESLKVLFDGQ